MVVADSPAAPILIVSALPKLLPEIETLSPGAPVPGLIDIVGTLADGFMKIPSCAILEAEEVSARMKRGAGPGKVPAVALIFRVRERVSPGCGVIRRGGLMTLFANPEPMKSPTTTLPLAVMNVTCKPGGNVSGLNITLEVNELADCRLSVTLLVEPWDKERNCGERLRKKADVDGSMLNGADADLVPSDAVIKYVPSGTPDGTVFWTLHEPSEPTVRVAVSGRDVGVPPGGVTLRLIEALAV